MAENVEQHMIRETWEDLYNRLKAAFPSVFEGKLWTDVEYMGSDPSDTSKMLIRFVEEPRD